MKYLLLPFALILAFFAYANEVFAAQQACQSNEDGPSAKYCKFPEVPVNWNTYGTCESRKN